MEQMRDFIFDHCVLKNMAGTQSAYTAIADEDFNLRFLHMVPKTLRSFSTYTQNTRRRENTQKNLIMFQSENVVQEIFEETARNSIHQ